MKEFKKFIVTRKQEEAIDEIRTLIAKFIENEVKEELSYLEKNYEEVVLPYTLKLVIGHKDGKLMLDEEWRDYLVTDDFIDEAIYETSLNEFSDIAYVELEGEGGEGYAREKYSWEKHRFYRCAFARFESEYDVEKGEVAIVAECSMYFWTQYYEDHGDPFYITQDSYIDEVRNMITDEAAVKALDKAVMLDAEWMPDELEDEVELTDADKEILTSVGYYCDEDDD